MRDLKKNSHQTLRIVILVMILLGVIILVTVDPSKSPWLPKCPIWLATGLYCPGCGSQRAAHALFTGHFAEVFRFNLYLLFAGPYLAALIIERLLLTGKLQQRCRIILEHKYTIYFYLATYCIWFVVRNILKI